MWEVLELAAAVIAGAAMCAGGYFYGLFRGFRQGQGVAELEGKHPPKPVCGCKHNIAFHDDKGVCRKQWYVTVYGGITGEKDVAVTCSCQKYTGPEPLPSFYAPEIH